MGFEHISVLLSESVDALGVKQDGIYVDGTLGGGGHSELIASRLGRDGVLIGIDRDTAAIAAASERLKSCECTVKYVHDNFFNIRNILNELGIEKIDGAILDLGVSSPQLDIAERGFSYNSDARLDMRMNRDDSLDAYKVVNEYSEAELRRILYRYGEERNAAGVAAAIVKRRKVKPISTTLELSEVIKSAFPPKKRYADKHPAKRSFQAIRIEVNHELDGLEDALYAFAGCLKPGGVLSVITFHSLEDRAVKTAFYELCRGCTCPKEFPVCVCGKKPSAELINKKPITAGEAELEKNNRAHSAKLRCLRKL
ncbi:MAG TPA: 16S rRNA (cytosine(1402)-N(4))-methyltransferase RsmH [Candidatus Monoglobus merdigallinarum]|uniref:Ribosomal RNA small subunit methyltransferase H n=1 Tax=Candidatus Monoglobus merdigallinarum TaxID=2838698 RepID=A0A9D1TKY8_9FIRM|nr:16S rRNA (cytosine(1402)-N(4))-methyltransferase RsmH [Candidatus Monoglobus merdigallinarum]